MIDAPVLLLVGGGSRRLERAAMERAARLLCRHGCPPAAFECVDCRRIVKREHPDLLVAAPESRRRANVPAFEESGGSRETTIPTSLIRAISSEASRRPYEGSIRALLLLDVERTDPAALNALLKVLEEPPPAARFILTAARPRRLPATILSRVVVERIPGSARGDTLAALLARGVTREEAESRAAFAPNDVDEAAGLDIAAARALRDALLESVSGVLFTNSPGWALALADALTGEDAADTSERLTLLAQLLRDAVAAASGGGSALVHEERARDLARLGGTDARRVLEAAYDALELSASLSESTRNPRLSAEAFALSILSRPLAAASGTPGK